MSAVETYLRDLRAIKHSGAGVKETSYYGPLSNLLNEVGRTLKPKVLCIIHLQNVGAGIPDGGLFTPDQIQDRPPDELLKGTLPARGALEVKSTGEDVRITAQSKQVADYLGRYRQVLVTNYRDFVLVVPDSDGGPRVMESYALAANEADFWSRPNSEIIDEHAEPFVSYLQRVMLQQAGLADPGSVAWFLASYARAARNRIEKAHAPALQSVRKALEEALGMNFQDEKGEAFFRATLVQTLFYGVFSAWVLWHKENPARTDRFNWRTAQWQLHVPIIRALFEQVATPTHLTSLDLVEVLDWAGDVLNRVERPGFFEKFEEAQAVQYFYEPFLKAYDPELRKQLGVWYTPPEIVEYMVERVDTVLREELGISEGLADPRVYVLDPCCGTGAYLVHVLRRIAKTLVANGGDALVASDLKAAAVGRVFGFEILPAPFVVSHLQLGLLLQNLGAPLADDGSERAAVYLTNALTGWEPPSEPKHHLLFPELEQERDAAERVKQETPILVILGNPPYNGFAGVAMTEERELSEAYRTTKKAPAPQGQGLNDLYVRFFRMAERRIVEKTGRGVVCFISNYSWLDGLSFTGMRERYLEAFDRIWIDNLHGDRIISEYAPDGRVSETVFAMRGTSPGIKVGTAIALLTVRETGKNGTAEVLYTDFNKARAAERRGELLQSLPDSARHGRYAELNPNLRLGLPYKPRKFGGNYTSWPLLPDLFPKSYPGIQPCRDDLVVDIDRVRLEERMQLYFDSSVSDEEIGRTLRSAMTNTDGFNAKDARKYLLKRGFLSQFVIRYTYRPFDTRWLYWEPETKLLDRKREDYFRDVTSSNQWIATAQKYRREVDPPFYLTIHGSRHIVERGANLFPLLKPQDDQHVLSVNQGLDQFNLSEESRRYLRSVWPSSIESEEEEPAHALFYHSLAVMHSPAYREENAGGLRQDWPRIPLPDSAERLRESAALGRTMAGLLDTETPVPGVTAGEIRHDLNRIAVISRESGGALNPDAGDLELTAGWGYRGKGGAVMPATGRPVLRDYSLEELKSFASDSAESGVGLASSMGLRAHNPTVATLGETTRDVYLNDLAFWRNVPVRVWSYTIGGYQVIKKWLSYREKSVLGRSLRPDEAREVTAIARRIAAILMMESELDSNYQAVKATVFRWDQVKGTSSELDK